MTKWLVLAFPNQVLLEDYIPKCWWRKLVWTWKQCALTASYTMFPFASPLALNVLFCYHKKGFKLPFPCHISPNLQKKLVNWTSAIYLIFYGTVLPIVLNILILMNIFISIICNCLLYLYFFSCSFTVHCICINLTTSR